jgi:hypothetical protein
MKPKKMNFPLSLKKGFEGPQVTEATIISCCNILTIITYIITQSFNTIMTSYIITQLCNIIIR